MAKSNAAVLEELRWKKFPVLDDGFVCLVDAMGDDAAVVQAARVSYNQDARAGDTTAGDSDRNLIRYLMRHRHTTPMEMAEIKLFLRIPMDAWRQMIRHRTANVNEYSTRYTEAIDSKQKTAEDQWRLQATNNKQGSSGLLTEWPDDGETAQTPGEAGYRSQGGTPGAWLTLTEEQFHRQAAELYKMRLDFGVAREQARKDLPLSTYTEAYWKCDLHNVLHFLGLRMDAHAQLEIRQYATIIGEQIVAKLFPEVWAAFCDYRVNALTLTSLDIAVMQQFNRELNALAVHDSELCASRRVPAVDWPWWPADWRGKEKCRERDECIAKLQRLGVFGVSVFAK